GRGLVQKGDYAAAEPLLREALTMVRRLVPDDHPDVAITQSGFAALLLETGRHEEARATAAAAADVLAGALGEDHWRVAWARTIEGAALLSLERTDEAEPLLLDSYTRLSEGATGRRMQIDFALRSLVALYAGTARPAEADRYRSMQSRSGGA
ncbi:MAG TPA: tetratricopeptide repeat protein, partial [Gammaproteobacteria bacterium]|nr:tetratricopeptide repeat protein [Gammaproteobacteria bacterium]